MNRKKLQLTRILCLSLLIIFIFSPAWNARAQMGKLYDANHQLSSNFTNQVYLDNNGFIWSASRNGLNRYDGYQFHIYKKEKDSKTGMASNYVNCIVQDHNGRFYLGMWGVLQVYDGNTFQTIEVKDLDGNHIDCYVTCFLVRKNGELWVGTSGFGVLKMDDSEHAHQVGGPLKGIHTAEQLMEDSKGNIWVLTREDGLICFNEKTSRTYFKDSPLRTSLRKMCEGSDGTLYLGIANAGLFKLAGNEFQRIENTGNKPINELYFNSKQELMLGYDGEGLGIYNPQTGTLTDNPFHSLEVDLPHSKVVSITEDQNGNYWFGLLQKGIFMQPGTSTGFNYMGYKLGTRNIIGNACILSTCQDSKGRIWIGTDKDGLYCIDGSLKPLKHFKENFPASIMAIEEDLKGRIWIGSYNEGGGWIDPTSLQYHRYVFPQAANISIFDIEVDNQNRLWFGTMGQGVVMLDQQTNKMETYKVKDHAENKRDVNSITNDYISQLSISPDNKRLYVATSTGVCCLDLEKNSWTSFFGKNCLNYATPTRTAREYSGRLWIGTNDGLYCYDLMKKTLKQASTDRGLSDNGIASIEQDAKGRLWIATDHGLCCYDPKTDLTQNYFIDNGLQSNEFSDGASWTSSNGTMLFGGVGGLTWFNPADIKQDKWEASVRLVRFLVNSNPINSASKSGIYQICDTAVIASNRFQLAAHDNNFGIQFSTLTYDNPEQITYLYSINGEEYSSLQPGVNEITFTHLPPGAYRFRVKAVRNNIETPEKVFTVIIHSPWYRSAWAYCLYLLVIGAILAQLLLSHRRREKNRLRLQEHIHAEEMSDAKLRFFMNISHEIRTPMTLILTPLLSLIKNEEDPQRKGVYEIIKRNAERILSLINQMMDLRKIDKGQMQMRMTETDLIKFVKEIYDLFDNQAKTKLLTFTYEHDDERLPVWIDRRNFDKVIMNILSNAFKFTPSGGKIDIRVTHDDQTAHIAISDNGEKIPEDKLDKIFERFYQTASTVNDRHTGTGIGLDLTRSLVELHYGTITARNLEQGCEFVVTIPLGNAHLKPEEMILDEEAIPAELMSVETETPEEEELPVIEQPSNHKMKIVIAEDDDEIRDYLDSELSKDYDVRICVNGREALAEVLHVRPDLVLSDVMMPEMDGNTLCSKIKSNPSTNYIPVILLTAKNRDEDKLEGLETGADAYVVKPFNMDILRRTIINLLNSHRLLQLKYGRNDNLEEQVDEIKMKSPDEKLLERVMTAINAHLDDSDLSVDMIAEQVGISRVHLHRKMKELTGQTPHDFIRNLRLKQAANLLANQGMNVTEVMYACGFSNSASFSTVFKKFYGMSPRDYMKEHQRRK
ncbi:MAG: helix-turn-helix domain-containing protein [Prevotella sp.]|nr:helix-turn-helix domain-containing protein [Prevotella sp.]